MGKSDFLTPKAIANRIKAKGLQKLRWYCQMCQKQCRDENGFKCHCESESHQRQMSLFASNSGKFVDTFSRDFLDDFMELIKRRYPKTRVHCNQVYNEFIKDRHHTHMNSTQWVTLTNFIKWLGKEGYCLVDETPKGWYLIYIDRDPENIRRQESLVRKEKADIDADERLRELNERQLEELLMSRPEIENETTELQRDDDAQVIAFTLSTPSTTSATAKTESSSSFPTPKPAISAVPSVFDTSSSSASTSSTGPTSGKRRGWDTESQASSSSTTCEKKRKLTAAEELMLEEEKRKDRLKRKANWIQEGIVVKVMNKSLADGKLYKAKGIIEKVHETFLADIRILDEAEKPTRVRIDQAELETVIPAIGGRVKFVNGAYSGSTGILSNVDVAKFSATVKIDKGPSHGRVVSAEYEDICKILS